MPIKTKKGGLTLNVNHNDAVYINDEKIVFLINEITIGFNYLGSSYIILANYDIKLSEHIVIRAQRSSSSACRVKFFADKQYLILREELYLRGKLDKNAL